MFRPPSRGCPWDAWVVAAASGRGRASAPARLPPPAAVRAGPWLPRLAILTAQKLNWAAAGCGEAGAAARAPWRTRYADSPTLTSRGACIVRMLLANPLWDSRCARTRSGRERPVGRRLALGALNGWATAPRAGIVMVDTPLLLAAAGSRRPRWVMPAEHAQRGG